MGGRGKAGRAVAGVMAAFGALKPAGRGISPKSAFSENLTAPAMSLSIEEMVAPLTHVLFPLVAFHLVGLHFLLQLLHFVLIFLCSVEVNQLEELVMFLKELTALYAVRCLFRRSPAAVRSGWSRLLSNSGDCFDGRQLTLLVEPAEIVDDLIRVPALDDGGSDGGTLFLVPLQLLLSLMLPLLVCGVHEAPRLRSFSWSTTHGFCKVEIRKPVSRDSAGNRSSQ